MSSTEWYGKTVTNGEDERICKEVVTICLKVLSCHSPVGLRETMQILSLESW